MKQKSYTADYAALIGFYWMTCCVTNAFASLYLLGVGFSNTAIGLLLAIASGISAVLQPLVSRYGDNPRSPALPRMMLALGLGIAVLAALLYPAQKMPLAVTAVLYTGCLVLMSTLMPLTNAIGMETLNQGKRLNFGLGRSFGSVGYAVTSTLMGILAAKLGKGIVPAAAILLILGFSVACFRYRLGKGEASQANARQGSIGDFLHRYRRFCLMLLGCVLIYISHVVLNNYTLQIAVAKGGSSVEMGVMTAISACVEVPVMVLFGRITKRWHSDRLIRVSAVFFVLKALSTQLAGSVIGLYAAQLFQSLGYGLFALVIVYYVNQLMRPEDTVTGQGFASMSNAVGGVLGSVIGGRLLDVSVDSMLLFSTIAAALGAVVVFATVERQQPEAD